MFPVTFYTVKLQHPTVTTVGMQYGKQYIAQHPTGIQLWIRQHSIDTTLPMNRLHQAKGEDGGFAQGGVSESENRGRRC